MRIMLAVDGSLSANFAVNALVGYVSQLRDRPEIDVALVHLPVLPMNSLGSVVNEAVSEELYEEDIHLALEYPKQAQATLSSSFARR